jgi:ketosteroid isomerase-like protein
MKRMLAVAVGALVAPVMSVGLAPNCSAVDVVKELTEIQKQWEQGELKKDRSIYDRVCADDYIQGTRTGQVLTKEQWLEEITKPGGGLTKYHTDSMQIRVLGNGTAALETLRVTVGGQDENGKPWQSTIRGVRVFEKEQGIWKALTTQFSPPLVAPKE